MSSGGVPVAADGEIILAVSALTGLPPSLYLLSQVEFVDASDRLLSSLTADDLRVLLEVREDGVPPRDWAELLQLYTDRIRQRESDFRSGFGEGSQNHSVFVFVKEVLITTRLRFDRYEVIPLTELLFEGELALVRDFVQSKLDAELADAGDFLSGNGVPTAVVWFPVVRADSANEASLKAETETYYLLDVLSLERGAVGSIFATVDLGGTPAELKLAVHATPYRGNLIGGTGEDPDAITAKINSLKASDVKQLYLTLYRDAVGEQQQAYAALRY